MPKKITIDDLAIMVQRGFEETSKKTDLTNLDEKVEKLDDKVEKLEGRVYKIEGAIISISDTLAMMRKDIYEIKTRYVYRDEFDDALARISLLEKKAGIKSGK